MKIATQTEVASDFVGFVKATRKGPVIVTDKGKPVAVLLCSNSEDDLERLLMGHSPKLQTLLEAARKRFRAGQGIPHAEFWKQFGKKQTSAKKRPSRTNKNGSSTRHK